jgi:hypothetical protein
MKKVSLLFVFVLCSVPLWAGNVTIAHTTAQSNVIQGTLIPTHNRTHCTSFGLPGTCTSAQLVTAGCTVKTFKTVTIESCVIFTSDAAGEAAFLQEFVDQKLVDGFNQQLAEDVNLSCAAFKAASTANQNSACTAVGRPTGCTFCQ